MIREAIQNVVNGTDLTHAEATAAMEEIMSGACTDAQIAAFLIGLRNKGESVEEISACAVVMREKATPIHAPGDVVVDTCGTGGDTHGTLNVSTAAAIVAAAGGAVVAKHGNRSVSSTSGSADVLRALGVNLEADTACVERCIKEARIGFLFAPLLHGAMKHAIGPRREIGVRTIFNILGPLTNPAGAKHQLLGVYASHLAPTMASVLKTLGSTRAMVVHGHDGMDEITLTEETTVAELRDGEVCEYVVAPEDFGLTRCSLDDLRVESDAESAARIRAVFGGEAGAARDIIVLNAGAALYVAERAEDLAEGVELAAAVLDAGAAQQTLDTLVRISHGG